MTPAPRSPSLEDAVAADGEDRVVISVRAQPRSARDGVEGVVADADGRAHLRVKVTAAPSDGAANAAIEKLLAKALGLPRSSVRVASGASARIKRIAVAAPRAQVVAALAERLGGDLGRAKP